MRIAIVSYHFTPSTMVAAVRARGLAKYLGRAGHSVTVVTSEPHPEASAEWDVVTIPGRTPSAAMRQALGVSQHHTVLDALSGGGRNRALTGALKAARRAASEVLLWPDEAAGWSKRVRRWLTEHVATDGIDVVISTSPPASTHLAALNADLGGAAWVADFRDLWALSHEYPLSRARRARDRRWEERIVLGSDAVTVATASQADAVREAYPEARVHVVYNGYDPEMFRAPRRATPNAAMTLVHAGSLYGGKRDPSVLFGAIRRLLASGRIPAGRLHVDFFSADEAWLARCIEEHGLVDVVTIHGTQPRDRIVEAYAAADVLVLLQWDDPGEAAVLPAKIFEYLAARRFVIAFGSRAGGEVDRLLAATGAGTIVRDIDGATDIIARLYDEFDATGFVADRADDAARAQWTQVAMAAAMLEAIDDAVSHRRGRSR